MTNEKAYELKITRGELVDLLLATLAAKELGGPDTTKWDKLHDIVREQLDAQDEANGIR